jgi:hypothetical protein
MPATPAFLWDQTYALLLYAPQGGAAGLAGRLEHVLSGECVAFESGAGLLAALTALQAKCGPGRSGPPQRHVGNGGSAAEAPT